MSEQDIKKFNVLRQMMKEIALEQDKLEEEKDKLNKRLNIIHQRILKDKPDFEYFTHRDFISCWDYTLTDVENRKIIKAMNKK